VVLLLAWGFSNSSPVSARGVGTCSSYQNLGQATQKIGHLKQEDRRVLAGDVRDRLNRPTHAALLLVRKGMAAVEAQLKMQGRTWKRPQQAKSWPPSEGGRSAPVGPGWRPAPTGANESKPCSDWSQRRPQCCPMGAVSMQDLHQYRGLGDALRLAQVLRRES
jgi:hypothetical protein